MVMVNGGEFEPSTFSRDKFKTIDVAGCGLHDFGNAFA